MNEEKLPSWDEMVAANRREGATPSWDEMVALEQQQAAKQNRGLAGDLVTDLKRGFQQIPGALTGLLDIPVGIVTGERMVGKGWEEIGKVTGFQPGKWADEAQAEYSVGRQQANQEVDQAWERGVGSGMAATLANPGRLTGMVVESLPSMAAGGLIGRGALAASRGLGLVANPANATQRLAQGVVAGGVGEGAMIAGQVSDNLSEDVGGREGALASLGAGVVGGFLGVKGGQLAQRMGVVDPETAIAAGMRTAVEGVEGATQRGLLSRVGRGALAEGGFEELPQSMQETMWQNWAEDDPIFQGVARAGFEGALAGGLMGGAFNIPGQTQAETKPPATKQEVPYNQMPSEQPALPGMSVPEVAESSETRPVQELLDEYRELRAQALAPEVQQRPELGQQLAERAKQLRQELGAQGVPWQVVDPAMMDKRINTLETEIRKGLDQYKNVLLSDPDKAPKLAERIQAMQYELEQFKPFLEQDSTQGSFDFGAATTVRAPAVTQNTTTDLLAPAQPGSTLDMFSGEWSQQTSAQQSSPSALPNVVGPNPSQGELFGARDLSFPPLTAEEIVAGNTRRVTYSGQPETKSAKESATAFSTPSGIRVSDPYNGNTERELTNGELQAFQAGAEADVMAAWKREAETRRGAGASVPGATASAPAGVSGVANTSLIEGTNVSAPAQVAQEAQQTSAPASTKRNALGLPEGYTFATGKNSRENVSASSLRAGDVIHADGQIIGVEKVTQKADGTVDLVLSSVGGQSVYNVSADRQLERRKVVKLDNSSQADSSPVANTPLTEGANAPTARSLAQGVQSRIDEALSTGAIDRDTHTDLTNNLVLTPGAHTAVAVALDKAVTAARSAGRVFDNEPEFVDHALNTISLPARNYKGQEAEVDAADREAFKRYYGIGEFAGVPVESADTLTALYPKRQFTKGAKKGQETSMSHQTVLDRLKRMKAHVDSLRPTMLAIQNVESAESELTPGETIEPDTQAMNRVLESESTPELEDQVRDAADQTGDKKAAVGAAVSSRAKAEFNAFQNEKYGTEGVDYFGSLPKEIQVSLSDAYVTAHESKVYTKEDDAGGKKQERDELTATAKRAEVISSYSDELEDQQRDVAEKAAVKGKGRTKQALDEKDDTGVAVLRGEALAKRVAVGDDSAVVGLLELLGSTYGPRLAQSLRVQLRMPASVVTPKDIVAFILSRHKAKLDALRDQFAEASQHWGPGFDALPEAAKLDFVDAMNGLGDLINTPAILRQVMGDIQNEYLLGRDSQAAEGAAGRDAARSTDRRNDEGSGESTANQGAVPVARKKKRRITEREGQEVTPAQSATEVTPAQPAGEVTPTGVGVADPQNPVERRVAKLLPKLGERQAAAVSKLVQRFQGGEISLERLGDEIQNYEDQVSEGVKFSRADKPQGTTARYLRTQLQGLFHSKSRFDALVTIFQSPSEIPEELRDKAAADASVDSADVEWEGVQGFAMKGRVYLIADNIAPGKELAVFLHETGVHLGMKNLLGQDNYDKLVEQIKLWAEAADGTTESDLARAALHRIMDAEEAFGEDMSQPDFEDELIAYFVEEAVLAGINPQALAKVRGPIAQWFRTLWASVKAALRKFGLDRVDTLTAQNLVDMAYGAARLEMEGTWHGTAADFRNFNHEYMGSGEGAQAFGWGTYVAQRPGIAKGYWEADVARKTGLLYKGEAIKQSFPRGEEPSDLDVALSAVRDVLFGSAYGKQMRSTGKIDVEDLKGTIADAQYQLMVNGDTAAYNVLENVKPEDFSFGAAEGSLMRVDVAVTEDEMLDWDKPLSEQSEVVRGAFTQDGDYFDLESVTTGRGLVQARANTTGETIYRTLKEKLGSDKAASEYLDSIGIKGIKFLDAMSRGNDNNLYFNGKRFDRDSLKAERKSKGPLADYSNTLRHILRNGVDSTLSELEAKVQYITGMFERNAIESAEKYGVPYDAVEERAKAERQALETYDGTQYTWLKSNAAKITVGAKDRTRNLVIFNDNNIQRITTQVGADRNRVKFSIARPQLPTFAGATDRVNDLLIGAKDGLDKLKLGFLTLEQLSWQSKSDKVKAYVSTMTKIQERAQGIVELASKIDQKWAGLSDKDSAALSKLMLASTKAGYDPSVEGAKPEGAEQTMIQQAFNDLKRRTKDSTGRSVATDLYSEVRDFYQDRYKQRLAILMDAANKAKLNGRDLEKIKEMYSKVPQPYFPMMRIGNYYAVGMSPRLAALEAKHKEGTITQGELAERGRLRKQEQHYITSSYDTLAEAQRAVRGYQQAGMTAYANEAKEQLTQAAVKLPGFAQMEAYMKAEVPDAALRDQLTGLFTKMVLEMTPENSAMKSMLKREGIAGAHQDMRQVFAKSAITQAHYISRLEYNHQLMGDLSAVHKEGEGDNIGGTHIFNELVARTKLAAEVEDHPIVDKLMNASYLAHLGASPAYWLLNATQVPMITFPWLGARFGFGRSSTALATAFNDARSILKTTLSDKDGWRSDIDWSKRFGKDTNEHKLLEEMNRRNLLSITMEHDLGATARMGGSKYGLGSFAKLVNTPVRLIEYANRATTALAAYRLEMAKSGNHDEAVEVAAKAVSMTQLNYSGLNTPRHMQSVLGSKTLARMMMQFRKFQQGMLYLTVSSINDAIWAAGKDAAETKQLRLEARKTLLGLYTTTGVMAGTLGFPMFSTVALLANAIANAGGDDDEPWDFETELRNFYADVLGKDVGLAFAKGLPAAFGVDLSKRVGMGDIGSPLPFVRAGENVQATAGNIALGLGGAPVGMMVGIADGMSQVAGGDVLKGAEKVTPLKLVKDIGKSIRYSDEGMTDRNGNVILPSDQFDPWDLTLRSMGLGTTKETEYYDANNAVQTAKEAATGTRNKLLRKYTEARLANEPLGDIQAEIAEFNQRHPQKGVRIDASSMLRSVQNRRNMAQERDGSGVRAGKANAPYLDNARFALGT